MAVSAAPAPGRKKSPLRSPVTWVIILGVTVGAGAWILWRRSQNASAAAAGSGSGGSTGTAADSGATDYSAALGTLQTEIGDLQSSGTQSGGTSTTGTGSTGTGTGSTGTGSSGTGGTGTGTGTGSSGGTKPGATAPKAPPVIGVINPGIGAVDISWTGVPSATGYELSITGPQGSAQASPKVPVTHARVQLPAGKKGMRVKVRGYNSAGAGPWSATRSFNVGGTAAKPAKKAG